MDPLTFKPELPLTMPATQVHRCKLVGGPFRDGMELMLSGQDFEVEVPQPIAIDFNLSVEAVMPLPKMDVYKRVCLWNSEKNEVEYEYHFDRTVG
jgi:hypothetical protein